MTLYTPVIDTCDFGHIFAKLQDHPTINGQPRCPHCMAIGIDRMREQKVTNHAVFETETNAWLIDRLRRIGASARLAELGDSSTNQPIDVLIMNMYPSMLQDIMSLYQHNT